MSRGWGNAPPDLKGTLGTLLRTTLIQLGSLRDAALREVGDRGRDLSSSALESMQSMQGSGRFSGQADSLLSGLGNWAGRTTFDRGMDSVVDPDPIARRREQVLATIGEIIYELARAKELDLDDFPELRDAVNELERIDSHLQEHHHEPFHEKLQQGEDDLEAFRDLQEYGASGHGSDEQPSPSTPASSSTPSRWAVRPNDPNDGVSSKFDVHAARGGPASNSPIWCPDPSDYNDDGTMNKAAPEERPARLRAESRNPRPTRRRGAGHISFVSDEIDESDDLSEYMHADDVPDGAVDAVDESKDPQP